jgi:hypothetical protein
MTDFLAMPKYVTDKRTTRKKGCAHAPTGHLLTGQLLCHKAKIEAFLYKDLENRQTLGPTSTRRVVSGLFRLLLEKAPFSYHNHFITLRNAREG